jgi:hypothetical protein
MGGFNTQLGGVLESQVTQSYNSFSGTDITASIGQIQFAEMQAVSYSVTREKAPIYTMGSADPRAFSRNKRGVAGSLIWINFDRHALLNLIRNARGRFVANVEDVLPDFQPDAQGFLQQATIFNSQLQRVSPFAPSVSATIDQLDATILNTVSQEYTLAAPWYSDQILPFDITLSGTNEYGACTAMKIYGCEILNEGSGISIDDAVTEMQATFVARFAEPWQAVASPFTGIGGQPPAGSQGS